MTLRKRNVQVPIYAGTTDSDHDFVAVAPGNAEVYDSRFQDDGAIGKRFGVELMPDLDDFDVGTGAHTITEHNGRLVAITHDGVYAHDEVNAAWSALGRMGPRPTQIKTDPVIRGNGTLRHADMAVSTVNGKRVALVVYRESGITTEGVSYAFFELPTDGRPPVCIKEPTRVGTNMNKYPKCAVVDSRFAIVAIDSTSGNLYGTSVDASSSMDFPTPSSIHALVGDTNSATIDFFSHGTGASGYFWVVTGEGSNTYIYRRANDFTASSNATVAKGFPKGAGYVDGNIVVAYGDGNIHVIGSSLGSAGTTSGPFITPATATSVHCATVVQADSTGRFIVAWSNDGNKTRNWASAKDDNYGLYVVYFAAAATGISEVYLGEVRLGGKAAWDGTSSPPLIPVINRMDPDQFRCGYLLQPCFTATDSTNDLRLPIAATYGVDTVNLEGSGVDGSFTTPGTGNHLPSLVSPSAGEFYMAYPVRTFNDVEASHVDMLHATASGSGSHRCVTAQSLRVWQGGCGAGYTDGVSSDVMTPVAPLGIQYGDIDTSYDYGVSDPSPGGSTFFVYMSFAYRWVDHQGNIHRSFLTEEQQVTWVSLDTGRYYARTIVVPKPVFGQNGDRVAQDYEIECYQSTGAVLTGGGDTRYFTGTVRPIEHPTKPELDYFVLVQPSVATGAEHEFNFAQNPDSGDFVVAWTDTTPAELIHTPPPPLVDVCSTQDRLWGLSAEKGRLEVWPTKLFVEGYAPEFCPDLVTRVPAEGGECTAIAALDDKVVVFKERAIFVLFGDPGTNVGTRSTLQSARLVSGDVGCSNPRSVVEGPFGIAFQASSGSNSSRGGIHVIDKGLSITFAGAPAKDTTAGVTFEASTLVPAEKEVRWVMPDSNVLVWSYDLNRWHVHTSRGRYSSTLRRGRYAVLADRTFVYVDQDGWAHDGLTTFSIHESQVTTNWIKLGGLQGFQRVWLANFLLRWHGSALKVEVGYDYDEDWTGADSRTWSASTLSTLSAGGAGTRVQVTYQLSQQKCEAIRFRISEDVSNTSGRGFELVGLTLEAGMKSGTVRRHFTPSSRK